MTDIVSVSGRPVIDYTGRDYGGIMSALREQIPRLLPEWTDYANESDFGNVLLELFAYVADILSYYQDRVANESFLSTAVTRRAVIDHLRLIGYRMRTAAPASALLRIRIAIDTQPPSIQQGAAFATKSTSSASSVRFEYIGADLTLGDNDFAPDTDPRYRWTQITVSEGRSIPGDVVGTTASDQAPNQRFALTHPQLILPLAASATPDAAPIVVTTSDSPTTPWVFQETLAFSDPDSKHFTLDIDENDQATIIFGDGVFGAIPSKDATVTAAYRVGGGKYGNVGAGSIVSIVDATGLVTAAAQVTNPSAATGGDDRESIDEAVLRAPAVFRSQQRAVTVGDYEALAASVKGIGKVRAAATGWNEVTLTVAPSCDTTTGPTALSVSDQLEADLKLFFEDKRMLTQIVTIGYARPVPIYVSATLGVESYFLAADVLAAVESAVSGLLAFDAVDFGQTLYLSRFYDAIQNTPGVRFVTITQFCATNSADQTIAATGCITVADDQIPVPPSDPQYEGGIHITPDTGPGG